MKGWLKPNPKAIGEYLVVEKTYGFRAVALYRHDLGWCIKGRWLGHDAIRCFQHLPDVPTDES